ncbi:hypothetical protein K3495_g901 [Podosphaera aphanis]|nr:hypothetical protein K3495_g901 [Podosphaera aphanis]
MQRAFDTFSLPQEITPDKVIAETGGLRVAWPDGENSHISFYPWSWIEKTAPEDQNPLHSESVVDSYELWGSSIKFQEPSVPYDEIMSDDKGVGKWTAKIRKFGLCYVDGCPVSPEKTKELIQRIAFIRETHYGGFYDFTSDLKMKDTAYTNIALALHTDTTYFTDPAGLQMLHLLSHEQGDGGTSIFVDGFKAARLLRSENLAKYNILAEKSVQAHSIGNQGISIKPARPFPVLNLADTVEGKERELYQVRWNNDDRGIVPLGSVDHRSVEMWYMAARSFNSILNLDSMQYKTQLKPGRPLIFDNWRVLHGRTAFTGKRRMCGAYINHDEYISRWRNTNLTRAQVLGAFL